MELNNITTLESLRDYIRKKYENEWKELPVIEALKRQNEILSIFELSSDESHYASALEVTMEEQSAKKTIINTIKAKQILIKRKNK